MRIYVIALIVALTLTSSAFAGNVALNALSATAACGTGTTVLGSTFATAPGCIIGTSFAPGNLIDATVPNGTIWVAPTGAANPVFVLISLPQLYTDVDYITVSGQGNAGRSITFDLYAGTSSTVSTLQGGTKLGGDYTTNRTGAAWTDTYPFPVPTSIQYVLYNVTAFNSSANDTTHDDAYANEIVVDQAPEPGTIGLIGAGLLALGFFTRRPRK